MHLSDIEALEQYEAAVQNGTGKKTPKCWKVGQCDIHDADISVHHNVNVNGCCTLCNASKVHCAGASWVSSNKTGAGHMLGTCSLKGSVKLQVNSKQGTCWLNTGSNPMPVPIIHAQSG